MKFQRRALAVATTCALAVGGTGLNTSALAQDIRVDVTGSNIKRTDVEGPAPVDIVTREMIQRSGVTTVNELLKYIPSIDIFDQGELSSNSPAGSGTGNIQMRGLSETNTLVLLNGRRLPVNAIYDSSGAGAAVDINMIPIAAIERVEILKDGGSAIYGADAVAGVVNFITRKDYRGVEASVRYGITERDDGEEWGATLTAGGGNLNKDGFNVMGTLDVFKRDPILRKDRDISRSVDFRRFGGPDARSGFAPEGNILDPNTFTPVGRSFRPCPPERTAANGTCRYDFNASLLTAYNGADRWSGMLLGSAKVGADMIARGHLIYAETKDHFDAHPVPDFFFLASGDIIQGRFMQGGPRMTDRTSKLLDGNLSLEGTTKWFEWDIAGGYGESKVRNADSNYYNANLWFPATEAGLIDPTVDTNDPAFVESLKVSPIREGKSSVTFFDYRTRGEAFKLPGGMMGWAVGGSFWKEKLTDTPDALTQQGLVVGSIQQAAVQADRKAYAVYGEVALPVWKNVEIQAAIRYDNYPDESKTSPKVAVLWNPTPQLAFRTSYTESFRVPSLKQLFGASEQGAANLNDEECVLFGFAEGCGIPYFQVGGSNPNLKPEKGKTLNVGVVVDLGPFSATVDWWRIEIKDQITEPTITTAIEQGLFARDQDGRLLIFQNLQNVAEAENEGLDIDLRLRLPATSIGTVTLRNAATYYYKQRNREVGVEQWSEFNGTYALPRWRNVFMASLEYGPWIGNVIARTVAGFHDTEQPWPLPPNTRKVDSYSEWDISGSYTGFRNWKLDFGVKNLFDEQPPFSRQNVSSNAYSQMGFAELYTSRGRFYYGGVRYQFM